MKVLPVRVNGAEMPAPLVDVFYLDLTESNVEEVADKVAAAIPKHLQEERQRVAGRQETTAAAGKRSPQTSSTPR